MILLLLMLCRMILLLLSDDTAAAVDIAVDAIDPSAVGRSISCCSPCCCCRSINLLLLSIDPSAIVEINKHPYS
jgi:hypothetical protein